MSTGMSHTNTPSTNQVNAAYEAFVAPGAEPCVENAIQDAHRSNKGLVGSASRKDSDQAHTGRCNKIALTRRIARHDVVEGLQKTQKEVTTSATIRKCCELPASVFNASIVERKNGDVSIEGLARCRNTICVNCSRVRAMESADKIKRIVSNARKHGHRVLFGTFGLNNRKSHDVRAHYKACLATYQKTFHTRFCDQVGIKAWVRSMDFTVKADGRVNLHWHCLFILQAGVDTSVETLYSQIYQRWADYAHKLGKNTSYSGNDLQEVSSTEAVSKYLAKSFNVMELVSRDKTSLFSWTIVDLLRLIKTEEDNARYISIYQSLEKGLRRTRQIAYSKGCSDFDVESDDDAELDDENEVVSRTEIPFDVWTVFRTVRKYLVLAWVLDGMARQYFECLCALIWDGEHLSLDEIREHKRVFMKAYERDFKLAMQGKERVKVC